MRIKRATDGRGIVIVMIHKDEDAHVICFGFVPEARGFDRGAGFVCKRRAQFSGLVLHAGAAEDSAGCSHSTARCAASQYASSAHPRMRFLLRFRTRNSCLVPSRCTRNEFREGCPATRVLPPRGGNAATMRARHSSRRLVSSSASAAGAALRGVPAADEELRGAVCGASPSEAESGSWM